MNRLSAYRDAAKALHGSRPLGSLSAVRALTVEAKGLPARLGDVCEIRARGRGTPRNVTAEVVAVDGRGLTLMGHAGLEGFAPGDEVTRSVRPASMPVGKPLLGRVVDGLGRPLDGKGSIDGAESAPMQPGRIAPLDRVPVSTVLETGVRAIDALLTLGRGQRIGLFAGSGVGKSTLLGNLARAVRSDVNVVAMIGERGREVRDFIERRLGPPGLARSVVVVATSDESPLMRVRAAHASVSHARHFADQGAHVVLLMDSVTRLAMARREIGLAAGEPPTARGYTPSAFAELPLLFERCGVVRGGGSVTLVTTVLVEGDDPHEPVADHVRALLDGHIVLSRDLAQQGHFPAIDVLRSCSRLLPDLASPAEKRTVARALAVMALLERHGPLVELGAYKAGSNAALDSALACQSALQQWLQQADDTTRRQRALEDLEAALSGGSP